MKILKLLSHHYFWLTVILFISLFFRLYKIDSPIADWHSWRQVDTASVTRNFIKEGFNPFLPKYDDMSAISENPLVNHLRLRFVEFPIYNILVYPFYLMFGVNEVYHRLVSIVLSLGSLIFVFFITRKYLGVLTALLACFCFGLLPFNVFFSRTVLPEPAFVFFALGMVFFLDRWLDGLKGSGGVWGFSFMAIAFLIKPWAIFFFIPLIFSAIKNGWHFFLRKFIPISLIVLLPFFLWRLWILQQPEGIPASNWLVNSDGIRFRPAFWKWIIGERLGGEILGVTGLCLFILGLIIKSKNNLTFLYFWALSSFLFIVVFATGNVRHNYYQISLVPITTIFLAKGFVDLIRGGVSFVPRMWTVVLAFFLLTLSFYLSWDKVKGFYQINNPAIIEAGKMADQILPKDAIVVAPYNGDSAFLYQLNRSGFPFVPLTLKELVSDYGVTSYVSVNQDSKTAWVKRYFRVLVDKPNFVIVDLTKLTRSLDELDPEP